MYKYYYFPIYNEKYWSFEKLSDFPSFTTTYNWSQNRNSAPLNADPELLTMWHSPSSVTLLFTVHNTLHFHWFLFDFCSTKLWIPQEWLSSLDPTVLNTGLKLLCRVWLGDPTDCITCQAPLSMGILQARILEWVVTAPRGSFWPRDWTWISCIAGRFFTNWATREATFLVPVTYSLGY